MANPAVTAIFIILTSWIVLASILTGIGALIHRALSDEVPELWRSFWLGFAGAIAFLQAWHLALRVSTWAMAVLVLIGVTGLFATKPWRSLPTVSFHRPATWSRTAVPLILLSVWLANRALGPPVGDAGLYHLSYVRWATEYPIVPGLANLHYRLGFNNPSLLWTASTNALGFGTHVSVSLLVAVATLRGAIGLRRLSGPQPEPTDAYWAIVLAPLVGQAVTLHELRISTPDPDTAMALVAIAAGGEFVQSAFRASRASAFAVVALALLAACLKLPAAPFALLIVALVAASGRGRAVFDISLVAVALFIPWIVRNVVQTGYPFFPLGFAPAPVDWLLPLDRVDSALREIHAHFMPPAAWALAGGSHWMRGWIAWQVTRSPELIVIPTLMALALARRVRPHKVLWLLAPCAASLVLWVRAPAPRFGYAFAWIAAAVLWVEVAVRNPLPFQRTWTIRVAATMLAFAPLLHRTVAWMAMGDWPRVMETLVLEPADGLGFHPTPATELRSYVTRNDLRVWVPQGGDQVWAAPIPASPEPDPDLSLRVPARLDQGFVLRRGYAVSPGP